MTDTGERRGGDLQPQEKTAAPEHKPAGELGGQPVNADETAPREHLPEPDEAGGGAAGNRQPDAVDGEPGSDL